MIVADVWVVKWVENTPTDWRSHACQTRMLNKQHLRVSGKKWHWPRRTDLVQDVCNNGDIVDGRHYSCNQKARGPHNQFAPCDFPESTCTSAAYPSPGAPAPGPGQMHRQVFCWIQDHVNAFAAGKLADHHRKDGGIDTGWHCRTSSFISTWGAWSHKSAQRSHRFKKSRTASLNGWTAVGFSAVFRKVRERVPQVWDFVKALLAWCC